jgi:hypothetical protein
MTDWVLEKTKDQRQRQKREVIDLRENIKAKGQYFSGKMLRKNKHIKRVKINS